MVKRLTRRITYACLRSSTKERGAVYINTGAAHAPCFLFKHLRLTCIHAHVLMSRISGYPKDILDSGSTTASTS